jgi:hypothetical protein
LRIETVGLGRRSGFPPRERLLGAAELRERGLPAPLELGRDKPVVGIDSVELPLGVMRLVAETVDLLGLSAPQRLVGLTVRLKPRLPVGSYGWPTAALASIGIGGHLAMPPLPHHRLYGSVPRRFGGLSIHQFSIGGNPRRRKRAW